MKPFALTNENGIDEARAGKSDPGLSTFTGRRWDSPMVLWACEL